MYEAKVRMSVVVGLNGLFGWWWADPLAALIIAGLNARDARDVW
jgi:divalent metal cation (Fe/Co/Zn/Cd) transporter